MQKLDPAEVLYERRCAKYIYVVPEGLQEIMTDISREVLRNNPVQLYCFISDFLDSLLITRENARVAAQLVENLTETGVIIAELLIQTNITRHQADRAARIIQRAFRRHLRDKSEDEALEEIDLLQKIIQKANVTIEEASCAVGIIQRAFRHYKATRQEHGDEIDWWLAAKRTIGILDKLKVPKEELDRCATLIKAAYKGYYMRKNMKKLLAEASQMPDSEVINVEYISIGMEEEAIHDFENDELLRIHNEILHHAATVIQRAYRAYAARNHILCGITHECSFLEKFELKFTRRAQRQQEVTEEQSPVSTPQEDPMDYAENPFAYLSSADQEMVINISSMGFPLPRVARACQRFNGNEEKIMEFLSAMTEFLERGFPELQVENALLEYENDRGRVLDLLTE